MTKKVRLLIQIPRRSLRGFFIGILTPYIWDEENRLTNIAYPSGALSTYVYSADGLRRKREESGVSLLEVWDGTQLLAEVRVELHLKPYLTEGFNPRRIRLFAHRSAAESPPA